jgi:1-deoxy-D-xylulose-5-phosphate reductoisomerase
MQKRIAILGSTGSIGTQTLEVIEKNPGHFLLEVLTANKNTEQLIRQARNFLPNHVVIADEKSYPAVRDALADTTVKVYGGSDALEQVVRMESIDMVLCALVGYSGLRPTLSAIEAGKDIALANKETLVVAGDLVIRKALEKGVSIIPVDSEHSAIFQCLAGEEFNPVEKIILTASGGPFLGTSPEDLAKVTREEALRHPNWCMGDKITIDSATLMNKGLEVIEAHWLFGLGPDAIDVVVHPQSIIHSMVEFVDGSVKAQLGIPDMKLPIQYALTYPDRPRSLFQRLDFAALRHMTFFPPDMEKFRCLALAFRALRSGGTAPAVLNAANEVAVYEFLNGRLPFGAIPDVIEAALASHHAVQHPQLSDILRADADTRDFVAKQLNAVPL